MAKPYDLSKPLAALEHDSTLVCVIEMSGRSWLVAATVPGVSRRPLQKLPVDPDRLLVQLERWRTEAARAGRVISRTVVAYESGRDGFWLARRLLARGIEAHVIHASSVTVSREQRRAKTDRLDTEMLMRALFGWLRGEPGLCRMVAIPTVEQEDASRPGRDRETLVGERTRLSHTLKAELALWGIQDSKPNLKTVAEKERGQSELLIISPNPWYCPHSENGDRRYGTPKPPHSSGSDTPHRAAGQQPAGGVLQ